MISVDASAALIANQQPAPAKAGLLRSGDRFVGTYTCRQGSTEMTLLIDEVGHGDDDVTVDARFEFHFDTPEPDDDATAVDGSYRMRGKLDTKARRLVLKPDAWIDEPQGWSMVGIRGVLGKNGDSYSGTVEGPGCTVFDTKLQGGPGSRNLGN